MPTNKKPKSIESSIVGESMQAETPVIGSENENCYSNLIHHNDSYEISELDSIDESCDPYAIPSSKNKRKSKSGLLVQRSEASQNISEFHLTEVGKEKVKLNDLLKKSKKIVKSHLPVTQKLQSLSVPLSKPQVEKIKRKAAYEKICDDIGKWDSVVHSNRHADQVVFPLKKPDFLVATFEKASENFISKHPVEIAVSELLKTSENVLQPDKPLTAAEEKVLKAMSLQEAKMRHNELMKHRLLISYKEAKARRQNKIKSKRYHRLLKKDKMKKMIKEFEDLKETDKAAALEKLMEADKIRVLERMTLKHRNTGKWAKVQKLRAKYNPESRSNLKEDIAIGRQFREKLSVDPVTIGRLRPTQPSLDMDFQSGLIEDIGRGEDSEQLEIVPFTEFDEGLESHASNEGTSNKEGLKVKLPVETDSAENNLKKKSKAADNVFDSEINLDSMVPSGISLCDEDLDDEDTDGLTTIEEAFTDEKLLDEFRAEKKALEDANRPQKISLFLPGWGSWGGAGIKPPKGKKRKFTIKPTAEEFKKKDTSGNVIFNEDKNSKAAAHQVNELPYPFTNIHQFQSYIRQPVGHTWNPQTTFQNLTAPKVVTTAGQAIQPIEEEDVLLKKKLRRTDRMPKKAGNLNRRMAF